LSGTADRSVRFTDLCGLLRRLSFDERINGDHHIFTRPGVREIINIQPLSDGMAKAYQVRQVRDIIVSYELARELEQE
jgi:hypothetical protein